MQIETSTTVEGDSGLEDAIARLEALNGQKASAGLFGGFAAEKAMWNEYGTGRGIPARPFLRNTMYEQERDWGVFIAPKVLRLMSGDANVIQSLGQRMAGSIRRTIDAGGFAPLAPSTIAKKGSSQTLIDTGDMYGSITWRKG